MQVYIWHDSIECKQEKVSSKSRISLIKSDYINEVRETQRDVINIVFNLLRASEDFLEQSYIHCEYLNYILLYTNKKLKCLKLIPHPYLSKHAKTFGIFYCSTGRKDISIGADCGPIFLHLQQTFCFLFVFGNWQNWSAWSFLRLYCFPRQTWSMKSSRKQLTGQIALRVGRIPGSITRTPGGDRLVPRHPESTNFARAPCERFSRHRAAVC